MAFIESFEGVKIYYEEAGNGPPLVFLHGWCMSSRVWAFQDELAASYRVIKLDLRGHGRSSTSAYGYAFADFAIDLPAFFAQLDLHGATLVGWSMGAQVALQAFPALRQQLVALVLVSGTPKFIAAEDFPYAISAIEGRGMALRLKRDYDRTMEGFIRRMFVDGELEWDTYKRIARQVIRESRLPELYVALESLAVLVEGDQRHMLADVDLPTLIIHGDQDQICLPEAASYMARQIADARLWMLEGVGHAPFLSRPAEFNAILKDFLQGVYGRN